MYKKLDREKGTKALHEGFVMIFGEKHRELLETKGEELIQLGIKNGKAWAEATALKRVDFSVYFEMFDEGLIKQEDADALKKDLSHFFTNIQIKNIIKYNNVDIHPYHFTKGRDEYESLFVSKILESDTNIIHPEPFDHFKEYIINNRPKISIFGECGLGLDSYSKKTLKYYQFENELFYMIEDISRKYHTFGMLLAKDIETDFWIDKIKNNITENINHRVKNKLNTLIYSLIRYEEDADKVILDIQKNTGTVEDFMTNNQVDNELSKIYKRIK